MSFKREKLLLFVENLQYFVDLVKKYEQRPSTLNDPDNFFRLKNLIDEYKLQLLSEELKRLNEHEWEGKQSMILLERVRKGLSIIDEYIEQNEDGLFIFTARMYVLKKIIEILPDE